MNIFHNPTIYKCLYISFGDDYLSHVSQDASSTWYSFAPLPLFLFLLSQLYHIYYFSQLIIKWKRIYFCFFLNPEKNVLKDKLDALIEFITAINETPTSAKTPSHIFVYSGKNTASNKTTPFTDNENIIFWYTIMAHIKMLYKIY